MCAEITVPVGPIITATRYGWSSVGLCLTCILVHRIRVYRHCYVYKLLLLCQSSFLPLVCIICRIAACNVVHAIPIAEAITHHTKVLLQNIPLYQKAGAGLAAGGLGALVGSPADLSLIRMQSDSTLPEAQRRNYKGVGDALTRIVKDEGAMGLFRGAGPTVTRAMALNMGMLASNDQASDLLRPPSPPPAS